MGVTKKEQGEEENFFIEKRIKKKKDQKKKWTSREMMFKMGSNLEFLHWSTGQKDIKFWQEDYWGLHCTIAGIFGFPMDRFYHII
jgi:hypothetical protein